MLKTAQDAAHTTNEEETKLLKQEIEDLKKTNQSYQAKLYQKEYADKFYTNGTMDADGINEYKENLQAVVDRLEAKDADTLTDAEKAELEEAQARLEAADVVDVAIGDVTYVADDRKEYLEKLEAEATEAKKAYDANLATITENEKILNDESRITARVNEKNQNSDEALRKAYESKRDTAVEYMNNYNLQVNYNNGDTSITTEQYQAAVNAIGDIKGSAAGDGTGAVRIEGQDAIIYVNGARFEGASNTFSINGLTITAQELTGTDASGNLNTVSITTSTDAQGIYDMVKDFLKGYNELINEMDKLYNAGSARDYEPLTSDEKEEMTDSEIELWETKIKDSLLRRDSSLNNVIQVMKNSMARGVNIDGKQYYLSEFGIQTAGYLYSEENERGAYHIDGDADDSIGASKTDKLMAAIMEDPEHVTEVLSGIAGNLYKNLTTAMRSTTLSSTYTVYNDKQMKEEYSSYTEKIADAEDEITWWEDYYRSKFTSMETMLASLNQQQSSLSGLLG